jgi:novobiocin biosynthesis protein NovU/D-mycarose 3-C-methyltransferase
MPLANSFPAGPEAFPGEQVYPLAVTACTDCGLVQLNFVVPAEQLYRDYIYVSSTSDGVKAHADYLAETLIDQYGWQPRDLIVEVASNDGTVLQAFKKRRMRVLGVEPARNIATIAEASGIPTIAEFFNGESARTVRSTHGRAAAVLGRHVFAHVDNVHEFVAAVRDVLTDDGVFIIEVPYLGDFLEKLEFDTIYHEHLSYFSLAAVQRLCSRHGMALVDAERVGLHGGSVVLHMRRAEAPSTPSARLTQLLAEERAAGLTAPARLAAFAAGIRAWKHDLEALIGDLTRGGATLVGYGAAAKANTLLNYCPDVARQLRVIFDRSPHKHGRYTPGTHIRVEPVDRWVDVPASHMLILAWNFQQEIMSQMSAFKDRGGHFIIPIPTLQVI